YANADQAKENRLFLDNRVFELDSEEKVRYRFADFALQVISYITFCFNLHPIGLLFACLSRQRSKLLLNACRALVCIAFIAYIYFLILDYQKRDLFCYLNVHKGTKPHLPLFRLTMPKSRFNVTNVQYLAHDYQLHNLSLSSMRADLAQNQTLTVVTDEAYETDFYAQFQAFGLWTDPPYSAWINYTLLAEFN